MQPIFDEPDAPPPASKPDKTGTWRNIFNGRDQFESKSGTVFAIVDASLSSPVYFKWEVFVRNASSLDTITMIKGTASSTASAKRMVECLLKETGTVQFPDVDLAIENDKLRQRIKELERKLPGNRVVHAH